MNNIMLLINEVIAISASWLKTISNMLTTFTGLLINAIMIIINMIAGNELVFYSAFAAIFFDLLWGTIAAIKRKKFILTTLLTKTLTKLFIYSSVFIMIMLIEKGLNDSWFIATRVVCAFAAGCELWSAMANILIVKPNFPFIHIFRKYLAGEIAEKLKLDKKEVEDELCKSQDNNQ